MREEFGRLKHFVNHVQHKTLRKSSLPLFILAEHGRTDGQTPEPVDIILFVYTYWIFFGICSIAFCVEWEF